MNRLVRSGQMRALIGALVLALALVILVDDLGLIFADQDIVHGKPQGGIELIRGDNVEGGARPHLDQRAVDGDEFDFVVVAGQRRRRAGSARLSAPASAHYKRIDSYQNYSC